jgi:hypothetical protein
MGIKIAYESYASNKLSVAATGHSRKPRSYEGLKGTGSGSGKRLRFCRRVFKESARGDLVVPECVDVCPLLLKPTACLFDDASLVTHDDHVALRRTRAARTARTQEFPRPRSRTPLFPRATAASSNDRLIPVPLQLQKLAVMGKARG